MPKRRLKLQIRLSELNPTSKTYAQTAGKLKKKIAALRLKVTNDGSNAFFDANGNMKSMAEITGILNKAFSGNRRAEESVSLYHLWYRRHACSRGNGKDDYRRFSESCRNDGQD